MVVVQIGANQGNDELTELLKNNDVNKLILVEPLNIHNDKLKQCYNNIKNLFIENIAIIDDSNQKEISFYFHKEDGVDYGLSFEIATLDKNHILKHGRTEEGIVEIKVPTMTINDLLDKYELKDVDILFMDVEGFDHEILLSIDYDKYNIKNLYFENLHLKDRNQTEKFVESKGFKIKNQSFGRGGWTTYAKNSKYQFEIFSNFIPLNRYKKKLGNLDKFQNKPITIFNDFPADANQLNINSINILLINEPNEFFGLHDYAINYSNNYNIILTWSDKILSSIDNAYLFPHGERNIDLEYLETFKNKERVFEVSFLRGILNKIEGHHLRYKIFDKESEIKIPHKWFPVLSDFNWEKMNRPDGKDLPNGNPIEGEGKKEVWNRNSMFHVAVENSQHKNYFTDKIIDCFCTKTLPIYWGAPNMGDFYDDRGIIYFQDENELVEILNNLTPDDYYSRLEYINNNYELAKQNSDFFKRIENFLDQLIELNNL
jgi:FkbM family methyltransferase